MLWCSEVAEYSTPKDASSTFVPRPSPHRVSQGAVPPRAPLQDHMMRHRFISDLQLPSSAPGSASSSTSEPVWETLLWLLCAFISCFRREKLNTCLFLGATCWLVKMLKACSETCSGHEKRTRWGLEILYFERCLWGKEWLDKVLLKCLNKWFFSLLYNPGERTLSESELFNKSGSTNYRRGKTVVPCRSVCSIWWEAPNSFSDTPSHCTF